CDRGRVRVLVGSMQMIIREEDLRIVSVPPKKVSKAQNKKRSTIKRARAANSRRELDLHALTLHEALLRLEAAINTSIIDGIEELVVIHGIGTGTLRQGVQSYLSRCDVISRFAPQESNPGVTRVWFHSQA